MTFARLLIVMLFALCIHLPAYAQPNTLQYGPFTVIQKEHLDLNGDGKKEVIELLARKNQYNLANAWKLIVDGQEAGNFNSKEDLYQLANMKFADLLGDGTKEILLYFQSVGSGGITGLTVFQQNGKNFTKIFNDPNPKNYFEKAKKRFSMTYLGNYQVAFADKQTGLNAIIPLSKERYKHYPNQEELQKRLHQITTWVDPVSGYRFEGAGEKKRKNIITTQAVSGLFHADVIAYFETTYMFHEKRKKYVPVKVALYSTETKQKLAEKTYR